MSNLHPIFDDIISAFTGGHASQSAHNLRAAAENAEMHAAKHDAREAAASKDRVRAHIQERMGDTLAAIDSALGREARQPSGTKTAETFIPFGI